MAPSEPALSIGANLTDEELADAEALVREAGWNQIAADWRIFLEFGTVYAVRDGTRRVVATAATLPYGAHFAWTSMVLVAGDHRRQGLATQLLHRCIDDLTARGLVPILDATPDGRAVYRRLGFEDAWSYHRLALQERRQPVAAVPAPEGVTVEAVSDANWPAICAYDAAAFGADRSRVLERLRVRKPEVAFVAHRGGRVVGFLLGRDGRTATQLGPLVAEDARIAQSLLANGINSVAPPVFADLTDRNVEIRAWLEGQGFTAQRPLTRMLYRTTAAFGDPARTVAVIGPEFG